MKHSPLRLRFASNVCVPAGWTIEVTSVSLRGFPCSSVILNVRVAKVAIGVCVGVGVAVGDWCWSWGWGLGLV